MKAEERAKAVFERLMNGSITKAGDRCVQPRENVESIIAQAIREAVAEEREACAAIAHEYEHRQIAEAIRARGSK